MVRTKTRARTYEEKWPNGAPSVRLGPKGRIVSNNLIFKDHTSKPALMSWNSTAAKCPLPPLSSWVYYMVHPDVPRDFDGCALHDGLTDGSSNYVDKRFRYEFFFLPGATAEECHAHYRGEMEARGTLWRQVRKVERAMKLKKQDSGEQEERPAGEETPDDLYTLCGQYFTSDQDDTIDSHLPGLFWPVRDEDCYFVGYRGYFFMYTDAEIETRGADGEARHVYLVRFDPIPVEWGEDEIPTFDPMQHPVHSEQIKVRDPNPGKDSLGDWMESTKCAFWEQVASQATSDALELGWESW
ncbi:hypothetical protein N0V84_006271 [Fusarium piperis]|uniref:Uncharacterized protein n=1 Tax=Fusarium piperis TaxID=1435070 RepID=A0A9W9BPU0_9HYPO|nr:hypothetical protein N0V84_006271 [Fusarium piperis]